MYRFLVIVLMAFAICYPRMDAERSAEAASYQSSPTRAERLFADLSAWLQQPIGRIVAALKRSENS